MPLPFDVAKVFSGAFNSTDYRSKVLFKIRTSIAIMVIGPARKRRRTSLTSETDTTEEEYSEQRAILHNVKVNDFAQSAARWDLEQDYERRPRKTKESKASTRLPIKTAEGRIEPSRLQEVAEVEEDSEFSSLGDDSDDDVDEAGDNEEARESAPEVPLKQQIIEAKEALAKMAALLNEDPEENVSN